MVKRAKELFHELKHHIPFTALASILALIAVIFLISLANFTASEEAFEILHPLHVLASAMVTAGIYYKYKSNLLKTIIIGIMGSILVGSTSDILVPYLGALIFNLQPHFHLPIIENTTLILTVALLGSVIGALTKITKIPHFAHVFLSVFASLFYLMAFTAGTNLTFIAVSFLIILISVIIPCCLSDMVFPFIFLGHDLKRCSC